MHIEYLSYLLEVERCQSINKAAKNLHLNQSNLSKILRLLEEFFQTTLFIRTTRGVVPTAEGQQVLEWVRKNANELNKMRGEFHKTHLKELRGELAFYIPASTMNINFSVLIDGLLQNNRDISIILEEKSVPEIVESVSTEARSVGVFFDINDRYAHLLQEGLLYLPLEDIALGIYASQNNPFVKTHKTTSLKAIANAPLLIYKPMAGSSPLEVICQELGLTNIDASISNVKIFQSVLAKGQHLTIGAYHKKQLPEDIEPLALIPIRDKVRFTAGLLVRRDAQEDPLIRAFLEQYAKGVI